MKKIAIYMRVSTDEQSVDSQRSSTEARAKALGGEVVVFTDVVSGMKSSRAELDEMMAGVRAGQFKAVICYKLDRLGRSLAHLAQMIGELDSYGVGLIATSQHIDTTDANPVARMQLHVLMAVAEFERSMIRERTLAGLEAAKKRGVTLGRPVGSTSIPDERKKKMRKLLDENPKLSCAKLATALGVSVGTAHAWKKSL